MMCWADVEGFLRTEAEIDLASAEPGSATARGSLVRPRFVAFRGDEPLMIAVLRPFPPHHYDDPLIELSALALPLGADRLVTAFSARAWSVDDPIPPVSREVDLRQQVLLIDRVDGTHAPPRSESLMAPFTVEADGVRWGDVIAHEEAPHWVARALTTLVAGRRMMAAPRREIRKQALRCADLGHTVCIAPNVAARLGLRGDRVP